MKHTYAKLLGLVLVLALVLSGCNLIAVDRVKEIAQEKKDVDKDFAIVLANYGDGQTVTKGDIYATFIYNYQYMYQMYSYFGMSLSNDDLESMKEDAVTSAVQNNLICADFEARGLTTETSTEELIAQGDEAYQSEYDSAYESTTGDTDEIHAAEAEYTLYQQGVTKELYETMYLQSEQLTAYETAVRAEITEADVTDEDIQTAYDEQVAADQETYADGGIETVYASEDTTLCWIPEGYRAVTHILLIPDDEIMTAYTDAQSAVDTAETELETLQSELDALNDDDAETAETDETAETTEEPRTAEEINADIAAKEEELKGLNEALETARANCLSNVQTKTDEIYARLAAGETFDALMAEYGEDPGMQSEPHMSKGYAVSANSTTWEKNFTAGAMSLAAVGDYTLEPVVSGSGVHIIYYLSDITAGAVPLEDVKETIAATVLDEKQTTHYDETVAALVEAANVEYHFDAWSLS